MKHHYIPVFYLKNWHGPDSRLCEWTRHRGRAKPRRTHASGTGYQVDLYRLPGVSEPQCHAIEMGFMGLTDNNAHDALRAIWAGKQLTQAGRSNWTRFLLSLLFRNPETLRSLGNHIAELWSASTEIVVQHLVNVQYAHHDEAERAEAEMRLHEEDRARTRTLQFITTLIDNPRIGPRWDAMHWAVRHIPAAGKSFMTSDRPLIMTSSLAPKEGHLALPIGPFALFIAANEPSTLASLSQVEPRYLIQTVNTAIVRQARRFVWSISDEPGRFVQRLMSADPDRIIVTDEARQKSLAALAIPRDAARMSL